jgi:asparagine synthase (glutamine-hydrolysing)
MCGIVGIVDFERPVELPRLLGMAHAVAHRGPDGLGHHCDRGVGLACQRLAIVDVPGGRQPLADERGEIQVVFNGEIYNHRSLRERLAARGHVFRSGSDGEVLPHLYEEYGLDFVDLLDGDFAVALWDGRERQLVLARDRVGVKPLYYHHSGGRFLFASEAKGLFASGLCHPAVDPQGLRDVFYYGQPCAPGTFWQGVNDLPAGHVLVARPDSVTLRRYYRPIATGDRGEELLSGREAIELFRTAFVEAVRKRVPDEVPYGATLSGGIDSTAIVAVIARVLGQSPPTASIRLPDETLDEGPYSRRAARDLGVENLEIEVTGGEACELLPRALWHLESPQWFGVPMPFLRLTGEARHIGVKVALTGDGSDELLGGYSWYLLQELERRLLRLARWGLASLRVPIMHQVAARNAAPTGAADHMLSVPGRLAADRTRFSGGEPAWFYVWSAMEQLTDRLLLPSAAGLEPTPLPAPPPHTPLHQALHYEYHTRLPGWILVLSDRLSMANGVEVRVPFMDRELLDLIPRVSPAMLVHRFREKHILKEALRDLLPPPIRRRRKKPFFTPIAPWYLSGPGEELAGTYLGAAGTRAAGIFDPAEVSRLHRLALDGGGRTWPGMLAEWACMGVLSTHLLVEQFRPSAFQAATSQAAASEAAASEAAASEAETAGEARTGVTARS